MKICVLFLVVFFTLRVYSSLKTDGRFFKDQQGRVVLLRGINVAADSKVPPFMAINNTEDLRPLIELGFNSFRLIFTWEAFEPQRGAYNDLYLSYIENIVKWAQKNDIYIIIDFHQDAFSRYSNSGCGEGFPKWAVPPEIKLNTPDNGERCRNWGLKMIIDYDMHQSYKHFYKDSYGVRTRYLLMVQKVAHRLSQYSNIIGYDVLNEPWGSEETEISPFYYDASLALRKYHPQAIMFYTPHVLTSSGIFSSKMTTPKLNNVVFSPHYYDATVIEFGWWAGFSPELALTKMLKKANSWKAPMFLGEFGSPASTRRADAYIKAIYDVMDKSFISGAHWVYTPNWNSITKDGWNDEDMNIFNERYELRDNFFPRPYPCKTAGIPIEFKIISGIYDKSEKIHLSYKWDNNPALGNTEFVIPRKYLNLLENFAIQLKSNPLNIVRCLTNIKSNILECKSDYRGTVHLDLFIKR